MALVIAKTIRLNGTAFKPGDEDALSEVCDKKTLDALKKKELVVDVAEPKSVAPKKTSSKKADAEE